MDGGGRAGKRKPQTARGHNAELSEVGQGAKTSAVQRPSARVAHRYLRIRMAGLCYDTPPVEAMPFPVHIPEQTPYALS